MVEVTEILLESIWRSSQVVQPRLCPLNDYISHVIRQSRISLYTLKCAIIYFVRMSRHLQDKRWRSRVRLFCGRRMFLGSVIIASKYLYDRTYSNSMWAKILSLDIKEVNQIQMDFLETLNYDLYISKELDSVWSQMLENFINFLKAKHNEETKEKSRLIARIQKRDIFPSPKCSHGILDTLSNTSSSINSEIGDYPNSPVSPETSVKTLSSFDEERERESLEGHDIVKNHESDETIYYNAMNSSESRKIQEYRPYVKVLIQVIFLYSKNNLLPVNEKKVIELPKLATNPDILFVNSYHRMNGSEKLLRYSGMMATQQYSFYRKRKQLYGNKLNSKAAKLNTLKYNFKKLFPNHHLLMGAYASYNPYQTSGYYSDTESKHPSHFHVYKKKINYQQIKEADDRLCGGLNPCQVHDEEYDLQKMSCEEKINEKFKESNDEYYKEMNSSASSSTSSSSEWESLLYDDSSTLLESSDEDENTFVNDDDDDTNTNTNTNVNDNNDDNTPHYNGSFFGKIEQDSWKYEQQNSVLLKECENDQKIESLKKENKTTNLQYLNKKLITPISKTIPEISETTKMMNCSYNLPSKPLMTCSINKHIYHEKIIYPNM
eukprot:jgi/Orpsp1_1/1191451/evm.model.d7180000085923.1